MTKLSSDLNNKLDIHMIIRKAKKELTENDYKFFINSSKNSISKLIALYFEYRNLIEEEQKQLAVVNDKIINDIKQYIESQDAERLGLEIKKQNMGNKKSEKKQNKSRHSSKMEDDEIDDVNVLNEEEENE